MFDDHNPYEIRKQDDFWDLWMEMKDGGKAVQISTRPVDYETARLVGKAMNHCREEVGYGWKIVMRSAKVRKS